MVVFFEREGRFVRCEARQTASDIWELIILEPDGTERIERFRTAEELDARAQEIDREYLGGGWFGPYGQRA